ALGWPTPSGESKAFVRQSRNVLFALTVLPLLVFTIFPALRAVLSPGAQILIGGGFAFLGTNFSYGVPLVLVALVLIGHALRERMPELALYAGACFNTTVTLAYLLAVISDGAINPADFVRLVQLNAITFAVYLLPWLSTRARWQARLNEEDQRFAGFLLKFQLFVAVALNAVLLVWGLIAVMLMSKHVGMGTIAIGSSLGWLSLLAAIVAAFSLSLTRTIRLTATTLGALLLSAGCLIAVRVSSLGGDAGLHALTVCV